MKTRYKIILVIGIFALFYMIVPLFTQHCYQNYDNCDVFYQLMHHTRAGMVVSSHDGIGEWSGTAEGLENPSMIEQFGANIPFIQTMIIPPIAIITAMILWDKRK